VADGIADSLSRVLERKGQALLCVSGGKSPIPIFHRLAQHALPWRRIKVTLVDERLVQESHSASNAKLVKDHLLQGLATEAQFYPWVNEQKLSGGPYADAHAQADGVQRLLDDLGPADVMVLGMGEDGHIASLFPQAAALQPALSPDQKRSCLPIILNPLPFNAPFHRLSVTLAYILKSAELVLPISGQNKLAVLRSVLCAPGSPLPVARVLHQTAAPLHLWLSS
jgi:6-phosphogluconolactonase